MPQARIYFAGVGGQGTLTATVLLAKAAMKKGLPVTAGEVHGMVQRGGVVESTLLIGGYKSPRISKGEADIVLGFEPLETLRALPFLKPGGTIISNEECIPPIGVTMGRETYPDIASIKAKAQERAGRCVFLPCATLGLQAGALQCGNLALMGALCATGAVPFGTPELEQAVQDHLSQKVVAMNIRAMQLGVEAVVSSKHQDNRYVTNDLREGKAEQV